MICVFFSCLNNSLSGMILNYRNVKNCEMLHMSKKELKTNAMRILDRMKITYEYRTYPCENFVDGMETADQLGLEYSQVFKTIVTVGKSGGHYVFVIPIKEEIDLKKAAKTAGEKFLELLPLKELTKVTGYVRGGCTAIGMKKAFPVVIQEDALNHEKIYISGGKLGMQLCLKPEDLREAADGRFADIIRKA